LLYAATDTTSTALSRILWLLSENQDVQDKLREELTIARDTGNEIDYDYLHNLPYLEAVCRETMRLYGPLATTALSRMLIAVQLSSSSVFDKDVNECIF